MKLGIVGTGYVGLVTGTCFAEMGNTVVCVDIDEQKLARLRQGLVPIHEPGLEKLVLSNYESGRLTFTSELSDALEDAEAIFIAVGTPPNEDGSVRQHWQSSTDDGANWTDVFDGLYVKAGSGE